VPGRIHGHSAGHEVGEDGERHRDAAARRQSAHLAHHGGGGAGAHRRRGRDQVARCGTTPERLTGAPEVAHHGLDGGGDSRPGGALARAFERLLDQRLGRESVVARRGEHALDSRPGRGIQPGLEPGVLCAGGPRPGQGNTQEQGAQVEHEFTAGRW
jgi:hypothetical protein